MENNNLQVHRLFILGAGFSKHAGLPLGVELLKEVRKKVKEEFQRSDWEGELEKEISEWKKLYPKKELNLESVLAYSHRKHFLRLIGSDEYFDHGSRSIVATRYAVQSILTERLQQETPLLYKEFASMLTPNDTILTFNYDTLLEKTMEELNIPYSLTPEWWLNKKVKESGDQSKQKYVDVIKLHGSIDWYDRRYYDQKRKYFSSQNIEVPDEDPLFGPNKTVPTEPLSNGSATNDLGANLLNNIFRVPNHSKYFPFAPSWKVVPFLLPPAYDKLLGSKPIRDLWQNMHRTLDSYSTIVIIGYSMPEYDGYAYEALGHLLINYQEGNDLTYWNHRRVPIQIITSDSSNKKALEKLPFLNSVKTRVWSDGFGLDCLDWIDWGK